MTYPLRASHKEPEWSSLCNNVFDQYMDSDDPFGIGPDRFHSDISNEASFAFNASASVVEGSQNSNSPLLQAGLSYRPGELNPTTQQPRPRESAFAWANKVRLLEQNANQSKAPLDGLLDRKAQQPLSSKGPYDSPPATTPSPINQSTSPQRHDLRTGWQRGGASSQPTVPGVPAPSRGCPGTVVAACSSVSVSQHATECNHEILSTEMIGPFHSYDRRLQVWAERPEVDPQANRTGSPLQGFPESPPSSTGAGADEPALVHSPCLRSFVCSDYDRASPLLRTLHHAQIQTPRQTPTVNTAAQDVPPACHGLPAPPMHTFSQQIRPLNDAPVFSGPSQSFPDQSSAMFVFGYDHSAQEHALRAASTSEQLAVEDYPYADHYVYGNQYATPISATPAHGAGLGISYDSCFLQQPGAVEPVMMSSISHRPKDLSKSPCYIPRHSPWLSQTPTTHRSRSATRSQSPSPALAARRSRRTNSSTRKPTRHGRSKSTNSTPQTSQRLESDGFVNFTPQDSNKLLSGVAPSGSSKTKARREREAAEKRRRLSRAAVKAVLDAGGSLDTLSRAGFVF